MVRELEGYIEVICEFEGEALSLLPMLILC